MVSSGTRKAAAISAVDSPHTERSVSATSYEDTLAEIHAEMRGVRNELARLRRLDAAMLAERDSEHDWLN